ncbi:MAG: YfhO family protein [Bacteroidales bacterium]|jgi:hypothetical protein|nr:YfhO family protein [Bacteroidales bacterium]
MKDNLLRSALPHLIAVIVFTVLSFAYFYPVLEGKKINAHDTKVFTGSAREIFDYREEYGGEPLWTNSMFGGMPAFLISAKFPGNLIKYLDNLLKIYKTPVAALFLSMLGFYILLLLLRVNPWLALAGAIAYGFTTFLFVSLSAGHNTKVYAMAYMAPVVGSAIYAFRSDAFKGAVLFALFLSLEIMANHLQITYYIFLILIVFGIYELIDAARRKAFPSFLKSLGLLIVAAVIAVGVNFAALYTTWEYSKESTRGKSDLSTDDASEGKGLDKAYITQWSYGIDETLTLLIPNFRGGATAPFPKDSETVKELRRNNMAQAQDQLYRYWGRQPSTSGPVYFGAVILFLFVFGLLILRGREKWWILTAVLLSLVLSWGKNLMPVSSLFIDFFPGYNKFRAVSMILVIAGLCVPLLSVLALKAVTEGTVDRERALKALLTSALLTGGLAFIFFLLPGLAGSYLRSDELSLPDSYNWLRDVLVADRKMMLRADALRSVLLIVFGAALIWFYIKERIRFNHLLIAISLLFLIDLIPVNTRFLGSSNFETKRSSQNSFAPTVADKSILEDKDEFRVLNLTVSTFNDASTSYHHNSIGGYSGAKMKRYQELIESSLTEEINALITGLRSSSSWEEASGIMANLSSLNMLNTRYIIISPEALPLENRFALGNVWFVERATLVENADAELLAIKTIDPATEAVVDRRFADLLTVVEQPGRETDTIYLTSYRPNQLTYDAMLSADRIAVFSEIYYPYGWNAYIDDKPADHFRTNYVLRGMVVPEGTHKITFRFEPQSYKTGNRISLAGSSVLLIMLLYLAFSAIKTWRKNV